VRRVGLLALTFVAGLAACDRPPSSEGLKEWSPSDHGGEQKGSTTQMPKGDAGGTPALVEITWRMQCSTCHGMTGKGDGPQAALFKAPDLGRDDWQSKVKDEEIAAVIKNGKGRMPKFDLSDDVVGGLVARVRTFRAK
jgi:mono/diheme cytochrome c family protein